MSYTFSEGYVYNYMQHIYKKCKEAFEAHGAEGCKEFLEKKQNEWKTIPLNVAVIGIGGVGKSSFINAIRGLADDDAGAAEVDVVEATIDIKPYPHPNNEMLKFWDIPGVGTDRFPRETYLKTIEFGRYDFFLLLSQTRFTQDETWLGKEIETARKHFHYVRTKVGIDIANNKTSHPTTHNDGAVLTKIRTNIIGHLKANGCETTRVFLIDNHDTQKFDFLDLANHLITNFPELKREAMTLSLCIFSENLIKEKAQQLRKTIWVTAATSALGAALTPVPGLSIIVDSVMVIKTAKFYFKQFGLDETSLRKQAQLIATDYERLLRVVQSTFDEDFFTVQGIGAFLALSTAGLAVLAMAAAEEGLHVLPFLSAVVTAPMSFSGTYVALKLILKKMEEVALEVVRCAAFTTKHSAISGNNDEAT